VTPPDNTHVYDVYSYITYINSKSVSFPRYW